MSTNRREAGIRMWAGAHPKASTSQAAAAIRSGCGLVCLRAAAGVKLILIVFMSAPAARMSIVPPAAAFAMLVTPSAAATA